MPRRKKQEEPVEEDPVEEQEAQEEEDQPAAEQEGEQNEDTIMTSGGEKLYVHKTEDSEEIGKLYEAYSQISESQNPAEEHEDAFKTILEAAKSTPNCKKLALQFIPKFFKSFENLEKNAISAMFDLIEEEEQSNEISIGAIKGLSKMCQEIPKYVQQVTQFLGQLIFGEQSEITKAAGDCILQISKLNVEASVEGFLTLNLDEESEEVKLNTFKFFNYKLFRYNKSKIVGNEKLEDLIDETVKGLMKNAADIHPFTNILFVLKKYQQNGIHDLLDVLALNGGFDELDEYDEDVLKKLVASRITLDRLGFKGAKVLPYFTFLVEKVLPKFDELAIEMQIEVLKTIASLSQYATPIVTRKTITPLYNLLLKYLPEKPTEEGAPEPAFNFSFAECLLYIFHQLAPKIISELNPICGIQFATGQPGQDLSDHSDKRKDLNDRLRFFKSKTTMFKKRIIRPVRPKNATQEQQSAFRESMTRYNLSQKLIGNLIDLISVLLGKGVPKFIPAKNFALSFSNKQRKNPKRKATQQGNQPTKRKRLNGKRRGRGRK